MPVLSRRKSMLRYFRACTPPRCQEVISPWALRPPVRFLDSSSAFSGVCLVFSLLSSIVRKRLAGVYGLNVFNGIASSCLLQSASDQKVSELNVVRVLDHFFAFRQPHVRFLPIAAESLGAATAAELPMKICRADVIHFHFKNALHCFLDFGLSGVRGDLEYHRVLSFLHTKTLLGNDGPFDNLIKPAIHRLFLFRLGLGLCFRLFLLCSRVFLGALPSSFTLRVRFHCRLSELALFGGLLCRYRWRRLNLNRLFGFLRIRGKRPAQLHGCFARHHQMIVQQ